MSFYLIKIESIKIGSQSLVSPLFTIVSYPTEEFRAVGSEKKKVA